MIIVKGKKEDIPCLMDVIDQAKEYLRQNNIDQWQDGYPNKDVLLNDINNDALYVLKDEEIVGLFVLYDYESTYEKIDGKWSSDNDYVVVHRIALDNKYKGKGYAKYIFDEIKKEHNYIRIDTHKDNMSMQKCLANNDFKYCGIIHLKRDNAERMAFDYIND